MMTFFTWLAGTRAGRMMAACGLAIIALFAALFKAKEAGKAEEKAKQDAAKIKAFQNREKIDDDVSKMDDTAIRSELTHWVRRDDKP